MRVTKNNSKCRKNREPKPFKSGLKVNTVKGETVNPYTGLPAYTFYEDDSIVNVSPQSNTVSIDNRDYENEIRNLETELTLLKAKIQALESRDNNNDSYNWRRQ